MDYGSVENLTILEIHSCKGMYEGISMGRKTAAEASHFPKYHLRWDLE